MEFFGPALDALVRQVQNIFFPRHALFQFIYPHRPPSWTGSRAGVTCLLICVSEVVFYLFTVEMYTTKRHQWMVVGKITLEYLSIVQYLRQDCQF